jgi:hypothetical protein
MITKLCFELTCLVLFTILCVVTVIPLIITIVDVAIEGYDYSMLAKYFEYWANAFERYNDKRRRSSSIG